MSDIPKIIISRKKPIMKVKCRKCERIITTPVNEVIFDCPICKGKNNKGRALEKDTLSMYLPQIIKKASMKNEIMICANERTSKDFDYLIKCLKDANLGWEIKESREMMQLARKKCESCGYCYDCVECSKCGEHYSKTLIKCPKCKESINKSSITYFKKSLEKAPNFKVCPSCQSSNIVHTTFDKNYDKCPKCNKESSGRIGEVNSFVCRLVKMKLLNVKEVDNG